MALALWYFAEGLSINGETDRIEIWKEGFVGSAKEIQLVYVVSLLGAADDEYDTPIPFQGREVGLLSFNIVSGELNDTILADLKSIVDTGADRDYQLIHKIDGVNPWTGWIVPIASKHRLDNTHDVIIFTATDRLESLEDFDHLSAGRVDLIVGIKDILLDTGLTLPLRTTARWKPASESGRPLEMEINRRGFAEQQQDGSGSKAFSNKVVLESFLRAYGLRLVQALGEWIMPHVPAYDGANVTENLYTTAGAYSVNNVRTASVDLDSTPVEFDDVSQEGGADEAVKLSIARYNVGVLEIGGGVNTSFRAWEDPSVGNADQAVGWIYIGGIANFHRVGPGAASDNLAIDEITVAEGASDAVFAAACTRFATQSWGEFVAGTVDIEVIIGHHLAPGPEAFVRADRGRTYYEIQFTIGGSDYFLSKSVGTWSTSHATVDRRIRMDGVIDEFDLPTNELTVARMEERITLPALPGPGVGELFIRLGNLVRELISGISIGPEQKAVYEDVTVKFKDDQGGFAKEFQIESTTTSNGATREIDLLIGDGPGANNQRAILEGDGTTLAAAWIRKAADTQVDHTNLVCREPLIMKGARRKRIQFTVAGITGVTPYQAFTFDGDRFWPVMINTVRNTGGPREVGQTIVGVEIAESAFAGTTTEDVITRANVFVGASEIGRTVVAILGDQDAFTAQRAVTVTTATIVAGSRTSATINPVTASTFKDNAGFAIVDLVSNEVYNLIVDGNYDGSNTINFDAFTFPENVKTGSYVVDKPLDGLTRLVITEAGVSIVVDARDLTTFKIAVTGNQTNLSSSQINPINWETLDQVALKVTKADATILTFYANGQQAAAKDNLDIEATPGGGGAVAFGTGGVAANASILNADDKDLVPTKLNVFFSGIEVQAKQFSTTEWDGIVDANGVITTPGTKGWCFTGVAGQPSDADITGTLTAGGGSTRIEKDDGIQIVASISKSDGRSIQFVDALGPSPTREYLTLWCETDVDIARIESDTEIVIRSTVANAGNISIKEGFTFTAGLNETIALIATSGTGQINLTSDLINVTGPMALSGNVTLQSDLILDADSKKLILGEGQDTEFYFDGANTIFQALFHGSRLHFNLEDDSGTNLAMLRMDPSGEIAGAAKGPLVSILTPESEPDGTTTNFPQIGSVILYRSAAGAGSNLLVKCRTAASTYETLTVGTFA